MCLQAVLGLKSWLDAFIGSVLTRGKHHALEQRVQ
jgi:hypothetical protein